MFKEFETFPNFWNLNSSIEENWKQAVAELGHTWIPNCQLGQCSYQVEQERVGMVLVSKRNFLKVYVKYL